MSAQLIDFASAASRLSGRQGKSSAKALASQDAMTHDFKFWVGASGKRYVHTIYSLIDCPEIDDCNFVLLHRGSNGYSRVLRIGRLEHDAPSLNLAAIRQLGVTLGVSLDATEVHVHMLGQTAQQRRFVELDVCAAEDNTVSQRAANH